MGKFLSAVLLALACVAHAGAAPRQSGVRVGPEVEESKPNGGAPKGEEKKPTPPAAGDKAAKPAAGQPPASANEAAKKETPRPSPTSAAKTPDPSDVTSTAAAAAPVGPGATHATTDAPAKPGPGVGVPVNNPTKSSSVSGNGPAPAPTGDPAAKSPNSNAATTGPAPSSVSAAAPSNAAAPAAAPAPAAPLTSLYRIGVGDILDIRLLNHPDSRQSTLYTVLAGGLIEYPLIREHVAVSGLTTEELAAQLVAELRHRGIFERPQVRVSVREYSSHAVIVSGLVSDPGTKILRREAVPLYVVVAESQPRPEAGRAVVISHATGKTTHVDLLDAAGMSMLVQQGDVISLTARPPEFFYVGGEIASPGQKSFHMGLTLTQAVLASGGVTALAGPKVKVLRQGADGKLVAAEYNLREIEGGQVPDPALHAGDRIEVSRAARK